MSILKNEIPILEFDTEKNAVINPTHENLDIKLPSKCVLLLEDYIEEYAAQNNLKQVAHFISATKEYPVYRMEYKGKEIVLCQAPVGAAAATQILDWLIGYGVQKLFQQDLVAVSKNFQKEHFSSRTKLCEMREHLIIMRLLHALWKSMKVQEMLLRKQFWNMV